MNLKIIMPSERSQTKKSELIFTPSPSTPLVMVAPTAAHPVVGKGLAEVAAQVAKLGLEVIFTLESMMAG